MEEMHWLVDTLIGVEPDDTTLLLPGFMVFQNGRLLVYDYGDARLKVFDPDGAWLWSFGRFGDGPGEFRNPTDAMIGTDGLVWVLDEDASRITRVSPDGELFDVIVSLDAPAWRLLPIGDQALVFQSNASDAFYQKVSLSGGVGESMAYPTQQLRDADPSLRFVEVAASSMGDWAAAFSMADFFLSYRDDELQCTGLLTVGAPITRRWAPADNNFESLIGVGWQGAELEVYSRAPPDSTQVFIDRYGTDCEYKASTLLSVPGLAASVVPGDDSYFILSRDPVPAVYKARRPSS